MDVVPPISTPSAVHDDFAQCSLDNSVRRVPVLSGRENIALIQRWLYRAKYPPEPSERMTHRALFRYLEYWKERVEGESRHCHISTLDEKIRPTRELYRLGLLGLRKPYEQRYQGQVMILPRHKADPLVWGRLTVCRHSVKRDLERHAELCRASSYERLQ